MPKLVVEIKNGKPWMMLSVIYLLRAGNGLLLCLSVYLHFYNDCMKCFFPKRLRYVLTIFYTCLYCCTQAQKFDVVIYGGTPGGVAAAIQVARLGKTVALLEPSAHMGGHLVEGLGSADIDNHKEFRNSAAIGGIALEFYRKLAAHYNRTEAFEKMLAGKQKNTLLWKAESSIMEKLLNDWLKEYKVALFTNTILAEGKGNAVKKSTVLQKIKMLNGKIFESAVFIDASYEGDLLDAAGVSTAVGRESNQQYGETLNGIRAETKHAQFAVKVDPYNVPGNPASGLIPTIQNEQFGTPGEGDTSLQSYCFRVCLTTNPVNQIPFSQPEGYDRKEYEIYLRYLQAGGKLYMPTATLPNQKTDLGAWHDLSHNLYGMNRSYPNGSYAERKKVLEYHTRFTKGEFYFLANDTAVGRLSPTLQQQWQKWGYAKDEFTDNGSFPRRFYVRDARRMVSDYVITEKTFRKGDAEVVEDPVAVAYWPPDVHSVRRIVRNGYAYNEGFVFSGNGWQPFGISYRALVPKKTECINLLTAACISASHIAYGATRLEHNFMDMGQACAIAAVLAIEKKITVQQVPYDALKQKLLEAKLVIDAVAVGKSME